MWFNNWEFVVQDVEEVCDRHKFGNSNECVGYETRAQT